MTTQRKWNFNAGPAAMPEEVLRQAAESVKDYNGTGLSVLELPHRGKEFASILEEGKHLVRELCELNSDYEVLWLHGGGRLQFCMVPMNFLSKDTPAGYIDSGHWAEEALEYAAHYGDVQILSSSKEDHYSRLPHWPDTTPSQLAYLHCTTNNTIYGTQMHNDPHAGVPLIADMSSDIFSLKRDYTRYAMFYAAAQKNFGPAGVSLVVIHKDMLARAKKELPPMLSYIAQVKENSVLNTANVFGIYASLLMLRWTKAKGIEQIEKDNHYKAHLLYSEIDRNSRFEPVVKVAADRSLMNVCFTTKSVVDEKAFLELCEQNNIVGIKGHRSVGGFRASIYNAVTTDAVQVLVNAMQTFEKQ